MGRWWQSSSDTQKSRTYANQLRVALGQKPKEYDGCWSWCCPELSWEERLMGFMGCFVIGCALSISSMFSFKQLLLGYPTQFAIKLALGNVLSISSAMFLAGPRTQLQKMSDPSRVCATLMYLGSIVFSLVAALLVRPLVCALRSPPLSEVRRETLQVV